MLQNQAITECETNSDHRLSCCEKLPLHQQAENHRRSIHTGHLAPLVKHRRPMTDECSQYYLTSDPTALCPLPPPPPQPHHLYYSPFDQPETTTTTVMLNTYRHRRAAWTKLGPTGPAGHSNNPSELECDKVKRKYRKLGKRNCKLATKRKRKTTGENRCKSLYYNSANMFTSPPPPPTAASAVAPPLPVSTAIRASIEDLDLKGYYEKKDPAIGNENEEEDEEEMVDGEEEEEEMEEAGSNGLEEGCETELNMIMLGEDTCDGGQQPKEAKRNILHEMDNYETYNYNSSYAFHVGATPYCRTGATSHTSPLPAPPPLQQTHTPTSSVSAKVPQCCTHEATPTNTNHHHQYGYFESKEEILIKSAATQPPPPPPVAPPAEYNDKVCFGCRQTLSTSQFIASVSGYHNWHINCLCCSECGQSLSQSRSCYIRNGRILCKVDYIKLNKCSKCYRLISASDWVRRAGSLVYHLACFACDLCQRQLSTGEKFTIEKSTASAECRLLCKLHFGIKNEDETMASDHVVTDLDHPSASTGSSGSSATGTTSTTSAPTNGISGNSGTLLANDNSRVAASAAAAVACSNSSMSNSSSKTKRVRTTFTEEQLSVLQANFQLDSNPDGQDLERIAALTGLSKRVTQVWFQNSRARQKKCMSKSQRHLGLLDASAMGNAAGAGHGAQSVSLLINGTRGEGGGGGVGGLWSPNSSTGSSNNGGMSGDSVGTIDCNPHSTITSGETHSVLNLTTGMLASVSTTAGSKKSWALMGQIESNTSHCTESSDQSSSPPNAHL